MVKTPRLAILGALLLAMMAPPVATARDDGPGQWSSPEAAGFSKEGLDRLHALTHGEVDQGRLAGTVTLLVRQNKIVDLDTYGHRSVADGSPLRRDTIFRLTSQSKPITGVAMMILYDEGKWKLDDPITKFVPEFAHLKVFKGLGPDGKPILEDAKRPATMRELLSDSAGFGYGFGQDYVNQLFWNDGVLIAPDMPTMIKLVAKEPLAYQPGSSWEYGIEPDIEGYIIEKLSGMSLPEFLRRRVFDPLGMKDTGFVVPAPNAGRLSSQYTWDATHGLHELTPGATFLPFGARRIPWPVDYTKPPPVYYSGGGGMVSTADDYAKLCQMLLNKGELNGKRLLSRKAVDLMTSSELPPAFMPVVSKGFGKVFTGPGASWGFDLAVVENPSLAGWPAQAGAGSVTWGGAAGTFFWIDPKNDMYFILLHDAGGGDDWPLVNQAVYAAMTPAATAPSR